MSNNSNICCAQMIEVFNLHISFVSEIYSWCQTVLQSHGGNAKIGTVTSISILVIYLQLLKCFYTLLLSILFGVQFN